MSEKPLNAREADLIARSLILRPSDVSRFFAEGRFEELAALADYLKHDVPRELAHTDIALFRALRRGVTELIIMGFGNMNADLLRKMAREGRRLNVTSDRR